MRIGFDARMIDHPGIGRYIKNLLMAALPMASDLRFVLYGSVDSLSDFTGCEKSEYTTAPYSLKEFFINPFNADSLGLVHVPHFNAPFNSHNKLIITIHDLIYLKFPESRPRFIPEVLARFIISNAIKSSERIIAVSENTRKDIIENFPYAADKIKVIYEAADPVFRKIEDRGLKDAVRIKYNLPDKIILFVGSLKQHKNIERLIDAYIDLKKEGIKHRLVIVGRYRPREAAILKKINSTDAMYLGEVSTDELVTIYNLADLMVIPSLYEGFGLPALEAMACGLPVAASSAASLPEVIGDAGILFNPKETSSISEAIYKVLTNERLKLDLAERGLKRAGSFTWEGTARQTLKIYREII